MDKNDFLFWRKLKTRLQEALLAHDFTVSESISTPNGGSRSMSFTSTDAILKGIHECDRQMALATGGGSRMVYPEFT